MTSVEYLRDLMNERLNTAAEEIFSVFKTIIVQYEQEIDRQRKLLDIVWKPDIKLRRIEIPHQHECEEEEVHAEQQLSNKDYNSSVIQKDPQLPQIKEEQEELLTSREAEEHEISTSMLTSRTEDNDQREPGQKSDHKPLSHTSDVAKSLAQEGNKYGNFTRHAELKPKKRHRKNKSRSDRVHNHKLSEIQLYTDTGNTSLRCDKAFICESKLQSHVKIHTVVKSCLCETCGKSFDDDSLLRKHSRIHSLERPFLCTLCGKRFHFKSGLAVHTRLHTGERPFLCNTCGKRFNYNQLLQYHLRTHTGEKPYPCTICGKAFRGKAILKQHMKIHRG